MQKQHRFTPALCAGILSLAATVKAASRTLPTPNPSGFADAESSRNVPLSGWNDETRNFVLTLAATTSPTSAVQVAFGCDANRDENLEPRETELVVGNDCGVWFVRNELTGQETQLDALQTNLTLRVEVGDGDDTAANPDGFFFSRRWDLAKVTTRGTCARSDLKAKVKFTRNGTLITIL